jgi:hypothetical protein
MPYVAGMIEFEDPEHARRWVEDAREQLCGLTEAQSEELVYFVDFFLPPAPITAAGRTSSKNCYSCRMSYGRSPANLEKPILFKSSFGITTLTLTDGSAWQAEPHAQYLHWGG